MIAVQQCKHNGILYKNHCFLSSNASSLKEAVTFCKDLGGWLITGEPLLDINSVPNKYRHDHMWLAGTSLSWTWTQNGRLTFFLIGSDIAVSTAKFAVWH